MSYQVEKGHQDRQPYIAVRTTVPMTEISGAMGPLFERLYQALGAAGIETTGQPWARYLSVGVDVEFEVGAPVAAEVKAPEGTISGAFAACDYVRSLHVGPYDTIGAAYAAMAQWLAGNSLLYAGAPWEVYLTDPSVEPDPDKYQTMVYYPVSPMEA